jgi:hypothetical protein
VKPSLSFSENDDLYKNPRHRNSSDGFTSRYRGLHIYCKLLPTITDYFLPYFLLHRNTDLSSYPLSPNLTPTLSKWRGSKRVAKPLTISCFILFF